MTYTSVWLIIALAGMVTLTLRLSFILGQRFFKEPAWLRKFLQYVPVAVLSALIFASLFITAGRFQASWRDPRYPAALLAAWVAWKTKNIFLTIVTGMLVLWSLKALLVYLEW